MKHKRGRGLNNISPFPCGQCLALSHGASLFQVRNSRGLLVALDRAQYVAGLVATACGCTFGVLEWTDSADPTFGSKNGSWSAVKMLSLALSEVVYFGGGAVAAVQVPPPPSPFLKWCGDCSYVVWRPN